MIVDCPSCSTQFNLDDSLIPQTGRKVKCSVCDHIFAVRPQAQESPADGGPPAGQSGSGKDSSVDGAREQYDLPDDLAAMSGDDLDSLDDGGAGESGGGSLSFDIDSEKSAKKKRSLKIGMPSLGGKKIAAIIGGGVGALALILVVVLYFVSPSALGLGDSQEQAQPDPVAMQDQVENISLEGIRQYYVENEKAGRLFVVEGRAVNSFDIPKELIEVEANLYDSANTVLATKRLKCGNKISLFQLQMLSKKEIETALADEAGIGSNNINIQPGSGVDFMIVFFNPPNTVAEFNIEVVAAKTVDL